MVLSRPNEPDQNYGEFSVLKFRTLFSFYFEIKCWFSRLEFMLVRITIREDPDQTASDLDLLAFFDRQLVFKILRHSP